MSKATVDVEDGDRVDELMQSTTINVDGNESTVVELLSDIKTAHAELDAYKDGSLSLAQTLSEEADKATDETLKQVLADMSDNAFAVYLRLHRGDKELIGERNGKFSGFFKED